MRLKKLKIYASLYGTSVWNMAYALLQFGMGLWHRSFWFLSLAGYYVSLSVMYLFLLQYKRKNKTQKGAIEELHKYRACGILFLVMNLSLSLMIFFMVYWNRSIHHNEITTIALATYTFVSFTFAVIGMVKQRKANSPVRFASKAIDFASACVSMLILESTMLTTFDNGTMNMTQRKIMLGTSGGAISVFIVTLAIYMIIKGTKQIRLLKNMEDKINVQ